MRGRILANMSSQEHVEGSKASSHTDKDVHLAEMEDPWLEKKEAGLLDKAKLQTTEPSIFHVPLAAYPMQPWARAVQQLKRGNPQDMITAMTNLQQWFNYEMTPAAWEAYAAAQREGVERVK